MHHDISMERTAGLYRILEDMGFGREIVGIFKKREDRFLWIHVSVRRIWWGYS